MTGPRWAGAYPSDAEVRAAVSALARTLHTHPEPGFEEHRAHAAVLRTLHDHGHTAESGLAGLPTALRASTTRGSTTRGSAARGSTTRAATVGAATFSMSTGGPSTGSAGTSGTGETVRTGGATRPRASRPGSASTSGRLPTVALLAELDALPGLGHGCGHNLVCAAAVGAFLLASRELAAPGAPPGRVLLLTTPAEENGTGKELLVRAGVFDEVDAALMVHPYGGPSLESGAFAGLREVRITFLGRAAHASSAPAAGRNALDAAVAAYQGVAALRQQLAPGDQVHGVLTDGGTSPHVIPDRAELHYYVRSATWAGLGSVSRRLEQISRGAALVTDTTATLAWDDSPACLPLRSNSAWPAGSVRTGGSAAGISARL